MQKHSEEYKKQKDSDKANNNKLFNIEKMEYQTIYKCDKKGFNK